MTTMLKRAARHFRRQWAGFLALFLVLTTGGAYALAGSNTVFTDDIVNGHVRAPDVAAGAITSAKVRDGSLLGVDLKDGTVTSADVGNGQVKSPDIANDAVGTDEIGNGQVTNPDLAAGSVDSSKVAGGSLTGWHIANETIFGSDVIESTLGQVPTALQGGLGRYASTGSCDPETTTFVNCSVVQVTLAKPARMLVIGTVRAHTEFNSDAAAGACHIGTTSGPVVASKDHVDIDDDGNNDNTGENMTLVAVTNVFPAGTHSFGVDCNQHIPGAIEYRQARVVAVALSAS